MGGDFKPEVVQEIIIAIAYTALVLFPHSQPWCLNRAWCVYEVSCTLYDVVCTVDAGIKLHAIPALSTQQKVTRGGWHSIRDNLKKLDLAVDLGRCDAREQQDKDMIMQHIAAGAGLEATNRIVQQAVRASIDKYLAWRHRARGH